jgi:CBS-domain-containing membrane protein
MVRFVQFNVNSSEHIPLMFRFLSGTRRALQSHQHFVWVSLPQTKTPWSESASEYRPSDRRLSANWLPTFADKACHVVSVTDPYGRIIGFLDRSRYFSIK